MNAQFNIQWLFIFVLLIPFAGLSQDVANPQSKEQKELKFNVALHDIFGEVTSFESTQRTIHYKDGQPNQFDAPHVVHFQDRMKEYQKFLAALNEIDLSELSQQDEISRQTMILKIQGTLSQLEHKMYFIPFNAEGGFFSRIAGTVQRIRFAEAKDYHTYVKWLPDYATYLKSYIPFLEQGIKEGIIAPKAVVKNTVSQLAVWTEQNFDTHYLTQVLKEKPANISSTEWGDIKVQIEEVMKQHIWPAYKDLHSFFIGPYSEASPAQPGITFLPGGKEYYQKRVDYFTTLDMSAEEVYQTGLIEVARIRGQMEAIIEEVGFEGDFAAFLEFLRTDEQFYPKTAQELLSHAAWLSKKAEGQLPRLFKKLYELPFTVEPVPAHLAPTYTAGRYAGGSRSADRAGRYWVNTYNLPARSLYNLPALTVHEAVPGHHLQNMIAAELTDIPRFRNSFYISAFGEGWGLYSEYLGEEMGMYETPYERFGRYTYEMWRACRLVVDVGLHAKGWTREKALDYLASNTALSIHEVTTEIDRYIGWPAQALSYKIGEIKIKELRERAEKSLGGKFDIKEFHFRVLRNGSVPLPILESEIDAWITEALSSQED